LYIFTGKLDKDTDKQNSLHCIDTEKAENNKTLLKITLCNRRPVVSSTLFLPQNDLDDVKQSAFEELTAFNVTDTTGFCTYHQSLRSQTGNLPFPAYISG